jgi:hypothetical protein
VRSAILLSLFALTLRAADPTEAVRQAALAWTQAAVKQDASALERVLADDLIYAHANGRTQTKAAYIAAVTKGPARYESFDFSGVNVRIYDRTAVLTAFTDVRMVGVDVFRVRALHVYVLNDGRWQLAAHQSARVAR